MNPERTREAVARLASLIQAMAVSNVYNVKDFEHWSRQNSSRIADLLGHAKGAELPPAHLLVKPFFHPKLPLVGLNYGKAQQLLRGHHEGWTDALRLCRGTVFELSGDLIALPYAKFFNLFNHEHPEADSPPNVPFEATVKLDGHLGPVFNYANEWHISSSGSFVSRTAKLGAELLRKAVDRKKATWSDGQFKDVTFLTEIIDPSTRIRCDYHGFQGLVLTGARNRKLMDEKDHSWLDLWGPILGLHITEIWIDFTLDDLLREVAEQKPKDREGFVIRFANGTRGKLKYKHYLDRMSDQNLSYNALMHSSIDGTLKSKMEKMPEELWAYADDMTKKLEKARHMADKKAALAYLYALVPSEKSTSYFRKLCRDYLAHD